MTHPAADLLRAIADGKRMEYILYGKEGIACDGNAALRVIGNGSPNRVRIAREMVTRTVTYPAPLSEKPKLEDNYWAPDMAEGATELTWFDDDMDEAIFAAGMAFATREDAEAAHKALFGGGQ